MYGLVAIVIVPALLVVPFEVNPRLLTVHWLFRCAGSRSGLRVCGVITRVWSLANASIRSENKCCNTLVAAQLSV